MNKFIKSPINYTGNKFRILDQLLSAFPKMQFGVFVDLFCGGATVGMNVDAKKIIMIDNNIYVIKLLETLAKNSFDAIILEIEKIIKKYNLSYSSKKGYDYYRNLKNLKDNNGFKFFNSLGYYNLRRDYNKINDKFSFTANIMLYMLMIYGFNNDIRFNNKGEFNLPIGKTDFNLNNFEKIKQFNKRAKEIEYEFICGDFKDDKIKKILYSADFIYMDPPYLITTAVYNENNGWNCFLEQKLMDLLDQLLGKNIPFALSNVLSKQGVYNKILENWINKNQNKVKIKNINIHYRNSSYNKIDRYAMEKEVLILGKG